MGPRRHVGLPGRLRRLSLWQLSEATLRARHLPAGKRLGKLISSGFLAVAYGSVGLSFAGFAVGLRGDSGDSTKDFSTALVRGPFGVPALIALGLTVIGVGVYFIVKGVRKQFKEELHHFEGTRRGKSSAGWASPGHVAKGVALILAGLLFVVAAAGNQPGESTGLDGSLKALRDHPAGPYLLVAIGAGLISYGMFALIRAGSAGCKRGRGQLARWGARDQPSANRQLMTSNPWVCGSLLPVRGQ